MLNYIEGADQVKLRLRAMPHAVARRAQPQRGDPERDHEAVSRQRPAPADRRWKHPTPTL